MRRYLLATVILLVSGCANYPNQTAPVWSRTPPVDQDATTEAKAPAKQPAAKSIPRSEPKASPQEIPVAPVVEKGLPLPPAASKLLAKADELNAAGQPREAVAQAERAQRIAPRNPEAYLALGKHYLSMGEYARAEQFTLRGISLASGQPSMMRSGWLQVATIREQAGNPDGALAARTRAGRY